MNALVEYAQRADLITAEKGTMLITYSGNRKAELVLTENAVFLIEGKDIKRIEKEKLVESGREEFEKALADSKGKLTVKVSVDIFNTLEKALGKFEIEL